MNADRAQRLAAQAKYNRAARTRLDLGIAHLTDAASRAEQAGMRRQAAMINVQLAALTALLQGWPAPLRDRLSERAS